MAYFQPYSRRRTHRESRRVRTEAEERRNERRENNNNYRGRGAVLAEHTRRANLVALNGNYRFDPRDWQRLLNRYDNRCAYCHAQTAKLTKDHVVPIARGGSHGVGNIVPSCSPCNDSKSDMLLVEWKYQSTK